MNTSIGGNKFNLKFSRLILVALLIGLMSVMTACGNSTDISLQDYNAMSVPQKITRLFSVFPDTSSVSRMVLATPEHLHGIESGQLNPSDKFIARLDSVNTFYIQSDYNNAKTLREYDPDFSWYDKVWDMDSLYGWYWFWGGLLVCVILSALTESAAITTIASVFYFFCGLLSFIFFTLGKPIETEPYPSVTTVMDSYKTTPSVEISEIAEPGDNVVDTPIVEDVIALQEEVTPVDTAGVSSTTVELTTTTEVEVSTDGLAEATNFDEDMSESKAAAAPVDTADLLLADAMTISKHEAKRPSFSLSASYTNYSEAYDALILQGLTIDSISVLSDVDTEDLVKMRFGIISIPDEVSDFFTRLSNAIDNDDSETEIKRLASFEIQSTGFNPSRDFVDEIELERNSEIEEALATKLALCYSDVIDTYLENEFGFFKSIWQGIRYIFLSKKKFVDPFEKGLAEEFDKTDVTGIILQYANNFKQTIETEHRILFGAKNSTPDFQVVNLTSFANPMTEEIKSKIIDRGALEAKDLGLTIMEWLIAWLVVSIILTALCNRALSSACEDELAVKGLLSRAKPKSTWGKIAKSVADIGSDIFFANQKAKIKAKYDRYKAIAGFSITAVLYIITYFFVITPSVKLDIEINQLMTQQFIEYYTSLEVPITQLLDNLISQI